jgi:hypothetical protein
MFGQIAPGDTTICGANSLYPVYTYFYTVLWPIITTLTVTIIPASCMIAFLIAIAISITNRRNRIIPIQQTNQNQHEKRRARFIHRQMFILMSVTLTLFFITTIPVALFRFAISSLNVQQPFSLSLLLTAIFGLITTANYSFNFYFHCLTSKLFRAEFFKSIPCSISIKFGHARDIPTHPTATQKQLTRHQQGTITQIMGQATNTAAFEMK